MAIILIDLDNTIRDTWSHFRHMAKFVTPDACEIFPEDGPDTYWFLNQLDHHPRITQLAKLWERPGLYEFANPYDGAVDTIKRLSVDHHIQFVTQPYSAQAAAENIRWIEDHFGPGWWHKLRQDYDRTLTYGDILVDDKPEIEGHQPFPAWKHVIFDQPYNRDKRYAARLLKWSHLPETLAKLGV